MIPAERLPALLARRSCISFPPAPWEALRDAFLSGSVNRASVLVLLLWTAIAGGAATRWFKWN